MTPTTAALIRAETVRIEPPSDWSPGDLRELWRYRELLGFLVWRDIKVRYKQTALGVAWAILQPLAPMVIFTVIFGRVAKLPSEGVPYPVFALTGLLPWQLFASALTSATGSLVGSAGLITKVYFPRLIIPLSAVGASLVDFAISSVLLAGLLLWYGITPGATVLLLPVLVVLALVAAVGVALWSSALNVRYRDVQYVMPFVLQIWLFASPVAYSASLITSPRWRSVYAFNPMAGIVQGFRSALLDQPWPAALIWPSLVAAALLFGSGLWYFRRTEDSFADLI
jgi:lipopolysaccharide transport system permease protein